MKKIMITGVTGFLGTNLTNFLQTKSDEYVIYGFNSKTPLENIEKYTADCDFVYNFAAVHRPLDVEEFERVNADLFLRIINCLEQNKNDCPILYSSSIQASDDSAYGHSKVHGEEILKDHCNRKNTRGIVYRLTNTFGPYARPNGHSVVATFCNNIAKGEPIKINDPAHVMHLQYVGDVVNALYQHLFEKEKSYFEVCSIDRSLIYDVTLQEIAECLYRFESDLQNNRMIDCRTDFEKKLLTTYISYRR